MSGTLLDHILKRTNTDIINLIFYASFIIMVIIVAIASLITGGQVIRDLLIPFPDVYGTDFFDSLRDNLDMSSDIYPPFNYFFYYLLGRLVLPLSDGSYPRDTQMGFTIYVLFEVMTFTLAKIVLDRINADSNAKKNLLFVLIILSAPSLYLIERGNNMLLVMILISIFISLYNSDSRKKRHIAFFAIALASVMKIYPAFLAFLMLRKMKKEDYLLYGLIAASLFFIPFLFVNGDISQWLNNIFTYSGAHSSIKHQDYINAQCFFNFILDSFGYYLDSTFNIISWAIVGIIVVFVCVNNDQTWKSPCLILTACLAFTTFKPIYALLLLVPCLVMFLNSKPDFNLKNTVYVVCFLLMFVPMINIFFDVGDWHMPLSTIVESMALLLMMSLLFSEICRDPIHKIIQIISRKG